MLKNMILILNCGSSSLKFAIINSITFNTYLSGKAEYLNSKNNYIKWKINSSINKKKLDTNNNYQDTLNFIIDNIILKQTEIKDNIIGIGHRVVHGGEKFNKSCIINKNVIKEIKKLIPFAPSHNPLQLNGINITLKKFPKLINNNVAIFDTAFHQTIPEESYLYAIPYFLYKKYGIRKYGAHGISNNYITQEASKILKIKKTKLNIINCHLGNGSSVSVIRNGICIDTSMGFSPLEGLIMGTRSGDIDPEIIFYLHETLKISIKKIHSMLLNKSGLLGLTGITSDFRYLEDNYQTQKESKRAVKVYCHRLTKYIGAYSTLMNGKLDAIIFTGGIGENSHIVRELTINNLKILGFQIDHYKNVATRFGKSGLITLKSSKPAFVIPTNEELIMAKDTSYLINK